MKRVLDFLIAAIFLVLFLPLFVLIMCWIKLDSEGPVFYRGIRIGRHGRPFRMFKFRTLAPNAEQLGSGSCTANDDPRITRAGKVLRKCKLDELPQFLNVLKGDMSLVGPRPEFQKYVDMYTDEQRAILDVRPGITDWATLWDSDEGTILEGCADPEKTYLEKIHPHKIRLQLEYVRKHSLRIDLGILLATATTVAKRFTRPRKWLSSARSLPGSEGCEKADP